MSKSPPPPLPPLDVAAATKRLPARSTVRPLLAQLVSASAEVRDAAFAKLEAALRVRDGEDPYARTWRLTEREAIAHVAIAVGLGFPPGTSDWSDPAHELVFACVASPHPALVPHLRAAYPRLTSGGRLAALATLGAIGTRAAATAVAAIAQTHGWPDRVYARVVTELANLAKFGDALFPALLVAAAAGPSLGEVTDLFVGAIARGELDPRRLDLAPLVPIVLDHLTRELPVVERAQRPANAPIAWRLAARYTSRAARVGAWLDLAGYLPGTQPAIDRMLARAARLVDPKLATFAAASLVRRRRPPAAAVFARLAASHETREMLWNLLAAQRALARFPAKWATWDAFAAAAMVTWLAHPSELGRPPPALEQVATVPRPRGRVAYVFRFKKPDTATWYAAMCGPIHRRGKPHPVADNRQTFSRFDAWSTQPTAEAHAAAMLATLAAWEAGR